MDEFQAAQLLQSRRTARVNFASFCEYIVPEEPPALHHRVICDALDKVISGEIRRLMIFCPPGSAKSSYSSVRFPPYYLGRNPTNNIICGSYGEGLSTTFGRKVRNIVDGKVYHELFDVSLAEDARAKGEWETVDGGSYYACGVGSGVTGRRADCGIIDDPVKGQKDADSILVRNETWNWYKSDFFSRLKPNASQIIIQCMTGDTRVTMSDGSYKDLKDINVGDNVATYDDGELSSSKVLNWKSQGNDSVYKIKTKSGIIARANERHPFLVEREGKLQWIRLKYLNVGESVLRVTGENGKTNFVAKMAAIKLPAAKGCVHRTTTKNDGLMEYVHHLQEKSPLLGLMQNSSTATVSALMTTICCSRVRMEDVLFASVAQKMQEILSTGTIFSALTTAMNRIKSEGFFATTVTWLSGAGKHQKYSSQQQDTSEFTLDAVESIEYDGVEEVFDIQVENTENFIANGLVSHNTRWHEDDLSGRILPEGWNGESGEFEGFDGQMWTVISMPAEACDNDILGREKGEWLWPDFFTPEVWEEIKHVQTNKGTDFRIWGSLYQQQPQPDVGVYFKREWFEEGRYKLGEHPETTDYGASDYAVSDGKGDYTEQGVAGFDKDFDLWFKDWWSGQTTADVWIDKQIKLAKKHKIYHWLSEVGVIRRAVEPFLNKRKTEMMRSGEGQFFTMHWMPHIGDKGANARAFQALCAEGKVHIPRCEWGDELIDQLVKFIPKTNFRDDKVDVCGLFGRILDTAFAPSTVTEVESVETDGYGFEEEQESTWMTA